MRTLVAIGATMRGLRQSIIGSLLLPANVNIRSFISASEDECIVKSHLRNQ